MGIFLTSGSKEDNLLAISINEDRYKYIDHVVDLMKLIFNIEPTITEYYEKNLIFISDREAIQMFKRVALEI